MSGMLTLKEMSSLASRGTWDRLDFTRAGIAEGRVEGVSLKLEWLNDSTIRLNAYFEGNLIGTADEDFWKKDGPIYALYVRINNEHQQKCNAEEAQKQTASNKSARDVRRKLL